MGNSAAHVLVGALNEGDDLLWDSVVPQQLPQHFSVHAVECLLLVYEVDVEGGVPLQPLLYNDAQAGDLVHTGSVLAEARLLVSELPLSSSPVELC